MKNDLISREELKKNMSVREDHDIIGRNGRLYIAIDIVGGALEKTPTADATPVVHAHWTHCPRKVFAEDSSYTLAVDTSCSKCNWRISEGMDSPFCPRCGARMDEVVPVKDD